MEPTPSCLRGTTHVLDLVTLGPDQCSMTYKGQGHHSPDVAAVQVGTGKCTGLAGPVLLTMQHCAACHCAMPQLQLEMPALNPMPAQDVRLQAIGTGLACGAAGRPSCPQATACVLL